MTQAASFPSPQPPLPVRPGEADEVGEAGEAGEAGKVDEAGKSKRVRPYTITGGRTRTGHVLQVETLIAAIEAPEDRPELTSGGPRDRLTPEMRAIVELCRRLRSVAEIAALLRMPLGVVRVLLSDLADQGRVRVHGTGHGSERPDRELLERVLGGLRRL